MRKLRALFFNSPLIFYDFKQKRPFSFKTSFGFSISTLAKPEYFGHGISFIISPAIASRDGPFAYPKNFFGLSIDTNLDPFGTPTELYIRLFNNSSSALASAKFIEDIRSGEEFTCWVEFEAITDIMMVYLDVGFIKPVQPLLVTRGEALDPLSSNNGIHFVGLTGSSNGCTEVYQIHSWALKMEQNKVEEEVNLEQ
ncbi:putative non-specific serine/threonine protein kinase [Medicago truncatula]|uniref:Putative non-specific serine/threonine protein kinase n=1 Tax=Medicago truncatula TaxID=3880 RepID=A0A396HFA4_MEDTR|nr:putative non-specific serine/threonine protein kinase [Medicago truncatula]